MSTATADQQTTPEYKVFIGNLSFKTTKEELRSFAEGTGGKVVDATIITKGPNRSLGYGFVTFATEDDMNKAAVELNHKELDGREINVEVARPKTVTAAATAESTDKAPRTRSTRRKSKTPKKKNAKEESASSSSDEQVKPSQTKKQQQAPKKVQEPKDTSSDTSEDLPTHRQTPKKKKTKQQKKARSNTKKSDDRPSSKTTLFVANLPYATTDDDIKNIFEGYKIVSAHVSRMNNGRSKGYGFAEFEDEDEQQRALQNVKDIQLDGRAVYLKVALSTDEVSEKVEALDINDTKK